MGATRRLTRWRRPSEPSSERPCPQTSCASPTTPRAESSRAPLPALPPPSHASSRAPSSAFPGSCATSAAASWAPTSRFLAARRPTGSSCVTQRTTCATPAESNTTPAADLRIRMKASMSWSIARRITNARPLAIPRIRTRPRSSATIRCAHATAASAARKPAGLVCQDEQPRLCVASGGEKRPGGRLWGVGAGVDDPSTDTHRLASQILLVCALLCAFHLPLVLRSAPARLRSRAARRHASLVPASIHCRVFHLRLHLAMLEMLEIMS
mmetsp:Transcript_20278/g.67119  ORF Transcript_20278/g.67119 Transcript_20278/m.67119 type:complete len:269 (+) Transcript_20278:166-972(+)